MNSHTPVIYGYARVSTKKQNIQRQINNIKHRHPEAIIFQDVFTGRTIVGRKDLDRLLKIVKPGDTICFDEVSRMARNEVEGVELYERLFNMGVHLEFNAEPSCDTSVYRQALQRQVEMRYESGDRATDKFVNAIITAIHEYTIDLAKDQIRAAFRHGEQELELLSSRTITGQLRARAEGKHIGLKKDTKLVTAKSKSAKEIIKKHSKRYGGSLDLKECCKQAGISKPSYLKYCREIDAENEKIKQLKEQSEQLEKKGEQLEVSVQAENMLSKTVTMQPSGTTEGPC